MKQRDIGFLVIGSVLGVLIGIALMSSDSVRQSLFGTAGLRPAAEPSYYLVDMDTSRNFLVEKFPEEEDLLTTAFTNVAELANPEANFAATFRATQPDVDLIVARAYTALTGLVPQGLPDTVPALAEDLIPSPLLTSLADGPVSSCLGIDENPYNLAGYLLYLYVEIPGTQGSVIPADWVLLEAPRDNELYWQRLACQTSQTGQNNRGGR
jgi:hypothetical protein